MEARSGKFRQYVINIDTIILLTKLRVDKNQCPVVKTWFTSELNKTLKMTERTDGQRVEQTDRESKAGVVRGPQFCGPAWLDDKDVKSSTWRSPIRSSLETVGISARALE